jgi:hypothetical protein
VGAANPGRGRDARVAGRLASPTQFGAVTTRIDTMTAKRIVTAVAIATTVTRISPSAAGGPPIECAAKP